MLVAASSGIHGTVTVMLMMGMRACPRCRLMQLMRAIPVPLRGTGDTSPSRCQLHNSAACSATAYLLLFETMLLRTCAPVFIDRLLAQRVADAASCSHGWHLQSILRYSPAAADAASGSASQPLQSGAAQGEARQEQPALQSVLELQRASPTGRLLDLFLDSPSPQRTTQTGAAASAQQLVRSTDPSRDVLLTMVQAVENCKPLMKVSTIKKGNRAVHVPLPIPPKQQMQFAVKWIVQAAKKRKESSDSSMAECLAYELLLAAQKKGNARTKRDDMHKIAAENRANVLAGYR